MYKINLKRWLSFGIFGGLTIPGVAVAEPNRVFAGKSLPELAQEFGVSVLELEDLTDFGKFADKNLILNQEFAEPIAGAVLSQAIGVRTMMVDYRVQRGDTLFGIARKQDVSLAQIIRANRQIRNPNLIFPGQLVKIPKSFATVGRREMPVQRKGAGATKQNKPVSKAPAAFVAPVAPVQPTLSTIAVPLQTKPASVVKPGDSTPVAPIQPTSLVPFRRRSNAELRTAPKRPIPYFSFTQRTGAANPAPVLPKQQPTPASKLVPEAPKSQPAPVSPQSALPLNQPSVRTIRTLPINLAEITEIRFIQRSLPLAQYNPAEFDFSRQRIFSGGENLPALPRPPRQIQGVPATGNRDDRQSNLVSPSLNSSDVILVKDPQSGKVIDFLIPIDKADKVFGLLRKEAEKRGLASPPSSASGLPDSVFQSKVRDLEPTNGLSPANGIEPGSSIGSGLKKN